MANKIAYIYVFTLSVGGKVIAKYAGQHTFKPKGTEKFDVSYLGSGTCWKWLRTEFGFDDKHKWERKSKCYEFKGKHSAIFTGNVAYQVMDNAPNDFEESVVEAMIQSEGLNMDLIHKYRGDMSCKDSKDVREFLNDHKDILGGKGVFVNQVKGGSAIIKQLDVYERKNRVEKSMLQFIADDKDKQAFINGDIGMDNSVNFIYENGDIKSLKLTHVFGTACLSLGYTYEYLQSKLGAEYFVEYDNSKKRLFLQEIARKVAEAMQPKTKQEKNELSKKARKYLYERTKGYKFTDVKKLKDTVTYDALNELKK